MGKEKDVEKIILAWKAEEKGEEAWDTLIPAIPVGEQLSDQDLEEVVGGCVNCPLPFTNSCGRPIPQTRGIIR